MPGPSGIPTLEGLESSLAFTETLVRWAALLAATFTALAAIGGVRLWLLQRTARPLREAAQRASEERIAALKEQTARLEHETAAARLETERLRARLAPRHLSPDQARELTDIIRPFAGQRFWLVAETNDYDKGSEQLVFSKQLTDVLVGAGWIVDAKAVTDHGLPIYRRVTTRGVEIGYAAASEERRRVAEALISALTAANIDATPASFTDILPSGILINVGLR